MENLNPQTPNPNPIPNPTPNQSTVVPQQKPEILKKFPGAKESAKGNLFIILGAILVVGGGVLTGWFLSRGSIKGISTSDNGSQKKENISKNGADELGTLDESQQYQEAEGKLVEGGIKGEGQYHLERTGGESQTVYLTSTAIGLDQFVGKNVKVWGETLSAINAPWLMDVVKIKAL